MVPNNRFFAERCGGVFLIGFGLLMTYRSLFQSAFITNLVPGSVAIGFVAPLLFVTAGICCYGIANGLMARDRSPFYGLLYQVSLLFSLVIPLSILAEHVFDINLGLDWQKSAVLPTPDVPHPGRVSANASVAFLMGAVAVAFMGHAQKVAQRWVVAMCVYGLLAISFASLIGNLLHIEMLYRIANGNKMLAATAFGLTVLGATLWLQMQRWVGGAGRLDRAARVISVRSVIILTLVALSSGAAGFAALRESFEESISANIELLASTSAGSIENIIGVSLRVPRTVAGRPLVGSAFQALSKNPHDQAALPFFTEFGASVISTGIAGVAFYSDAGRLIVQSGVMTADAPVRHLLHAESQRAQLRWADGYILYAENDVTVDGHVVGTIRTEERMPAIDKVLSRLRQSSPTTDVLLCGLEREAAQCAPTKFYQAPFRIPMYTAAHKLNFPINRALVGESGVAVTADLRGTQVYAAYTPVGQLGIGMVVKTNAEPLIQPLRARFIQLLLALLFLVAAGTSILLLQVRPLLMELSRERKRSRVILETSTDAFVALGIDGTVTDWNRAAEKLFGWSEAEAMGRDLTDLIVPEAQRAAHSAGFARFTQSGTGPVINNTLEVFAAKRDGSTVPIELSIVAYHNGKGYIANAFLRDISERKAVLEELSAKEKRLRTITDNLPVLITYIDDQCRLLFANATIETWVGIAPEQAVGKLFVDIVGPLIYEERREYMERALAGERVEFEIISSAAGRTRHLHTVYLPDFGRNGVVHGFYTLTSDISDLKAKEAELILLARFDALTGLPNRMNLIEQLTSAIARSLRAGSQIAVMYLDVDKFKQINDTMGHAGGDALLVAFAKRLKGAVRVTDTVARLSGDEFVIVLEGLKSRDEAELIATKVLTAVREPLTITGNAFLITTSIGIGYAVDGEITPAALLRQADEALYRAKGAGRNCVCI